MKERRTLSQKSRCSKTTWTTSQTNMRTRVNIRDGARHNLSPTFLDCAYDSLTKDFANNPNQKETLSFFGFMCTSDHGRV